MALKKPAAPSGAPDWIVTYGDLMSLLLCFFVLLAAMANFDDDEQMMMTAMESIREALGAPGQRGWMPDDTVDFKSLLLMLQTLQLPPLPANYGYSDQASSVGKHYKVRKVRDGLEVTIGGRVAFEANQALPGPWALMLLDQIAEKIRGHRTRVEVRGHTFAESVDTGTYYDPIGLSYARARSVRDHLISRGVDPERLRVVAVGPYEPIVKEAVSETQRAENRRVEIHVMQSTIGDYRKSAEIGTTTQPAEPEDAGVPTPATQP